MSATVIDTPAKHWRWTLEEACYVVARDARPMAVVEVLLEDLADAVRVAAEHGLLIRFSGEHQDLVGERCAEAAVARRSWVLELYQEHETDSRVVGLLLGYGVDQVAQHLLKMSERSEPPG